MMRTLIFLCALLVIGCGSDTPPGDAKVGHDNGVEELVIGRAGFAQDLASIKSQGPTVVAQDTAIEVSWEMSTAAAAVQRRAIMLTAAWCGPCKAMKKNCGGLIGEAGSGSPVETVEVPDGVLMDRAVKKYGLSYAPAIPYVFVIGPDEKIVSGIAPLAGKCTRHTLQQYLSRHQVEGDQASPPVTASVASTASPNLLAGIVAAHLKGCSQSSTEGLVGSLFDVTLEVPDSVPQILNGLTLNREWKSDELGLSVSLPERSVITLDGSKVAFSEPLVVTYTKSIVTVSADLKDVIISDGGKSIRLHLVGQGIIPVPDLTVVFE